LELPTQVVVDKSISTPTYGRFLVEPFERGFGTPVGNSLRRILLSSLEGAAVTRVKISGADHEFMSIPGVLEDVSDIILNIKSLIVKLEGDGERTMRLQKAKRGEVRASDIETDPSVTIISKDQLIATLTDDVALDIQFWVGSGRGYRTAEENTVSEELGVIASGIAPKTHASASERTTTGSSWRSGPRARSGRTKRSSRPPRSFAST
jgi:DNA-directed RNA polymerase subunit alpha